MKTYISKLLSIFTSVALVFCSMPVGAMGPTSSMPDFVTALTPSSRLGYVDSFYQGQTNKPVILIEDLHANFGVQKKIYKILQGLQPAIAQGNRPMVVGIEAAWGDIDTSYLSKEAAPVRKAAGAFLMKEAEISGMENFAANADSPVRLVGIDNAEDYMLHRDLIRKSLTARLALAQKISHLREAISSGKTGAPESIKHLWQVEESFEKNEIGLPELAAELGVSSIENYGQAEKLLYQKKAELANKETSNSLFLSNLVKVDQDLALLSRLFRQQLTLEEVRFVSHQVPEMLAAVQALMPGEDMSAWADAIRSAIDYYALALMRDKPLSENTYALAQANPDVSVVAVTGGFHTAGIAALLKEKHMSYVVIAPVVQSHTTQDETLYFQRMLGNDVTDAEIAEAVGSKTPTMAGIMGIGARLATGDVSTPRIITRTVAAFRTRSIRPFAGAMRTLRSAFSKPQQDQARLAFAGETGEFGNPGAALKMPRLAGKNTRRTDEFTTADRAATVDTARFFHELANGRLFYNVQYDKNDLIEMLQLYNMEHHTDYKIVGNHGNGPALLGTMGNKNEFVLRPEANEIHRIEVDFSQDQLKFYGTEHLTASERENLTESVRAALDAHGMSIKRFRERMREFNRPPVIDIEVRKTHDLRGETDLHGVAPVIIVKQSVLAQPEGSLGLMIRELDHVISNQRTDYKNTIFTLFSAVSKEAAEKALDQLGVSPTVLAGLAAKVIKEQGFEDPENSPATFKIWLKEAIAEHLETKRQNMANPNMPDGTARLAMPGEPVTPKSPEVQRLAEPIEPAPAAPTPRPSGFLTRAWSMLPRMLQPQKKKEYTDAYHNISSTFA